MKILAIIFALGLAACSSTYGKFSDTSADVDAQLARDTTAQLVRLYPPAKTGLAFTHRTADPYGAALVQDLRAQGFAVQEVARPTVESGQDHAVTATDQPPDGTSVSYVLDRAGDIYRVTVSVGADQISRAYNAAGAPLGAWAVLKN